MRLFRRATLEEHATAGRHKPLLKALAPQPKDFLPDTDGRTIDMGAHRRAEAARLCAGVEGDEVDDALAQRLRDPAPDVRVAALGSLVARSRPVEPALVGAVLIWPEADAREQGAALLVQRADASDADAARVVSAYTDQDTGTLPDEWVRVVFDAVHGPARREVVEHALQRATAEPDAAAAARQVIAADERLGVSAILDALDHDENRPVLVELLGSLRSATATGPLVDLLKSGDARVRQASAEALGRIQDPRAVEGLLRCSVDDEFAVRDAAQRALDALGTAGVVWSVAAAARGAIDLAGALPGTEETRRQLEAPAAEG